MAIAQSYPRLMAQLDDLRRQWRSQALLEGGLLAFAGFVAVLVATVAADNLLKLETAGRSLLGFLLWGTLVAGLLGLVVRRWMDDRRDDFFALLVERRYPGLRNQLINALQLGRGDQDGASPRLIEAIVDDANRETADLDLAASLDLRPVKRAALFLLIALAILLVYVVAMPLRFANGLIRVALPFAICPPYTATRVVEATVKPGKARVPEGSTVVVQAEVEGLVPETATLIRQAGAERSQSAVMTPIKKGSKLFRFKVLQASESFDYSIVAGDGRSRSYHVEVVKRPRVQWLALTYTPPAYTGSRPRRVADSDGEVVGIAGTSVAFELHPTKTLQRAELMTERGGAIPLSRGGDARVWLGSIVLSAPARYQIKLMDTDGYENADPLWRSIALAKDQPPTVTVTGPGRDLQVKPDAVVPLVVTTQDDFGVGEVRLVYRVNDEETVRELAGNPHAGPPALQVDDHFDFNLSGRGLKPGDVVQYWATAADRNTITGPGRSESRRFTLVLATPEEAVAKLDLHVHDYAQLLEELLRLQRENRAQTASGVAFETLIIRQSTIRTRTGQLARAMEQDALPTATIVAALDDLVAGAMAEAVRLLEVGRDGGNAARPRDDSLVVQDQIITELEALLARLQRNEQAKEALRKLAKTDQAAHKETTKTLAQMVQDLGRLIDDQTELAAKFEKLPKKSVDELKDESLANSKDLDEFRKTWEKWAKGTINELTKLPTGFVDDFQLKPDVNKIFEEIEKAAARPKATKMEIALEDMAVGLATKMKEDLEMWMPDTPDAAKWVMEEPLNKKPFKVPEMPLPSALEDMVGDLLQEAEEFDEEADDITSAWGDNLDQAGWGVGDGPISSFSAKGKTGNDLPNSMELTGRAGDGRRGKSSGQMVGDTARALAGRKTPARVGNERYEPGQLKQEGQDDPNGATGGGKKAGSGRKGLQGGTPPDFARDMGRLSEKQAGIREKTEQVARKLDPTGMTGRRLTESIALMKSAEADLRDLRYDDAARKRRIALGKLQSAFHPDQATAAQVSRARDLPPQLRTELLQAADEGYPAGYESLLKSYFNALSTAEQ